jgi:DAK2 domain fusion protein YloV
VVAAQVMDGTVVRRWCHLAADALGQARSAIDALNVYPVPDADTGTNLYRTLRSAAEAVDELPTAAGPDAVWRAAAAGAMLGACGNSGIIVSQLFRGLADICGPAVPCDGRVVARALGHAAELARAAVSRPAEGTVLTVADAAALAAAALDGAQLGAVVLAAARAARQALDLTTDQLEALAASGVVDAGGAGLCVLLDAWAAAISGSPPATFAVPGPRNPSVMPREPGSREAAPSESGSRQSQSFGYEVTYLVEAAGDQVARLREQLDSMGDSLVIAGGARSPGSTGLWSVHVHLQAAGAAIEAGLRAGPLRRITVTYLGARSAAHRVLAMCDTPGLAALADSVGAAVFRYDSDFPPAAEDVSAAIRPLARHCIIVPNGPEALAAATAAAQNLGDDGIEVLVVDVRSPVQALPALAVHEPAAEFWADAAAMGRAAARMRYASVRAAGQPGRERVQRDQAGRDQAGRDQAGRDQAGRDQAGRDQAGREELARALAAIDELLAPGAELLTVLTGAGAHPRLAERVLAHVREVSPATEIECHAGVAAGVVLLAGAE